MTHELEEQVAVVELGQALLSDGRSTQVAADALDAFSVAAIESEPRVHVEAEPLGDRLGVTTELGSHQAQERLAGTRAQQGRAASRHTGGIGGYMAFAYYLESQNIAVILLSNCMPTNLGAASTHLLAAVLGIPYP